MIQNQYKYMSDCGKMSFQKKMADAQNRTCILLYMTTILYPVLCFAARFSTSTQVFGLLRPSG